MNNNDIIKGILDDNNTFIESIQEKKYYQGDEKTWYQLIDRFSHLFDGGLGFLYNAFLHKRFLFGGSILSNFGKGKRSSLSNCYYIPIENDSLEAIGKALTYNMRTFSWRGGVGNTLEVLRPKNEPTDNSAKASTGSVSFMPMFSMGIQTIGQEGRRGAGILTHHIMHPDAPLFIKSKAFPEEVFPFDPLRPDYKPDISGANISIKLTDKFMQCVIHNDEWEFLFPDIQADKDFYNKNWTGDYEDWVQKGGKLKSYGTMPARELLDLIAKSSWDYAEPGVSFWDIVLDNTPMAVVPELKPKGMNPCGEQILANYDSCNLSAHVLYKYVINPFTPNARFDWDAFAQAVQQAVIVMDKIIDINNHPLSEQNDVNLFSRKIGIGITGLGDALAMLGYKYDSDEAIEMAGKIMCFKAMYELIATLNLAKRLGSCPALNNKTIRQKYAEHPFFKRVVEDFNQYFENIEGFGYEDIVNGLETYGVRNIATSTIAPTGTLSIIAGNCTSGIEPLFKLEYYRKSRLLDEPVRVIHPILLQYLYDSGNTDDFNLPSNVLLDKYNYVEASSINPYKRIDMQAICQRYVTDSISSTLNLPEATTVDQIKDLYMYAWQKKLKGITIYRENCRLGGVLTSTKDDKKEEPQEDKREVILSPYEVELRDTEPCFRHRFIWKNNSKVYIMVTIDEDGYPLEVFAKLPKKAGNGKYQFDKDIFLEATSIWDTICRQVSASLRHGVPLDEIVKQLTEASYSLFDPANIISRVLKLYPINAYFEIIDDEELDEEVDNEDGEQNIVMSKKANVTPCQECGSTNVIKRNGCPICLDCGYSKCG